MVLVAGSYERFIWGFSLKTLKPTSSQNPSGADDGGDGDGDGGGCILKPLFSYPSHTSSIKCVAVSGPVAVSGGADDAVKIYDLSSCSEIGSLTDQGGAVTAVAFYTPPAISFPRNLVTGSDGGVVSIYDADPFVHLKSVRRVHRRGAGVGDLTVHPSGRLALTVGRGIRASPWSTSEASVVRYSAGGGDLFFMAAEERISVHNSEDAREVAELVAEKKVLCVAPALNNVLITGGEGRDVTAWDITSGKVAYSIKEAHSARVKGLVVLGGGNSGDASGGPHLLASAATDGVIRVWDARMVSGEKPPPHLTEAKTKSRLTCLAGSSIKFEKWCFCSMFWVIHSDTLSLSLSTGDLQLEPEPISLSSWQ
ncbi:unnamed protein product [Spirodela intermedia]|uniref:Uncharacterized protein n=1 Tax=Spirodela intermedia TaxID=51605 RepID=A0A7I8JIC7_SPIIN|nr:unnamed protein product [Spirodela intermedia]CAA6669907.1 unnamed protein product [Spirodela intermedia]